jgi:hypothetical protein
MSHEPVPLGQISALHVHPVKGQPGVDLHETDVTPEGLAGDRRKKAPVHIVAAEDVRPDTRANLEVTVPASELVAAVGGVLRAGAVELQLTAVPSGCPGVYASVRTPGALRLGDRVVLEGPGAPGPEDS